MMPLKKMFMPIIDDGRTKRGLPPVDTREKALRSLEEGLKAEFQHNKRSKSIGFIPSGYYIYVPEIRPEEQKEVE